jgi:predicted PurR-regulated permease PerM
MDILSNPSLWETLNGANGGLVLFILFVCAISWGSWHVIHFCVVTAKELAMTVNSTLQEIKTEIHNLSGKVEKLTELPKKVEILSDRLEAIESVAGIQEAKRIKR